MDVLSIARNFKSNSNSDRQGATQEKPRFSSLCPVCDDAVVFHHSIKEIPPCEKCQQQNKDRVDEE